MDPRILLRRRIRALIAVCMGGMLAVCASCATKAKPDPADRLYDYGGFMIWSCSRPAPEYFTSRSSRMDPRTDRATVAHEEHHRNFAMAMGCEAWKEWRQDPQNRLIMEALAFCAQARQHVRDGMSPDSAATVVGRLLAHPRVYGFDLTPEQARVRILAVCP